MIKEFNNRYYRHDFNRFVVRYSFRTKQGYCESTSLLYSNTKNNFEIENKLKELHPNYTEINIFFVRKMH